MAGQRTFQPGRTLFGEMPSINSTVMQAATFDHWERRHEFRIAEFLALGFYWVTTGARCSRCGLIQADWTPDKNLLVQHAYFNPRCLLVLDFYYNPLINYYFTDNEIVHEIHLALVQEALRNPQ